MPKRKEPDFMKSLHRIRTKLSKEWSRMTSQEFLESMHESGKWLKAQLKKPAVK